MKLDQGMPPVGWGSPNHGSVMAATPQPAEATAHTTRATTGSRMDCPLALAELTGRTSVATASV
jgi:hypothetical protein